VIKGLWGSNEPKILEMDGFYLNSEAKVTFGLALAVKRVYGMVAEKGLFHKNRRCQMSTNVNFDLGRVLDEVFGAADKVGEKIQKEMDRFPFTKGKWFGEGMDYYPGYSYPPMNVYLTRDNSLVFEFALAGFRKEDLEVQFKGDYMIFNAGYPKATKENGDELRFLKKRLKRKAIENQKYFVPSDKFEQEKTLASYADGLLKILIPSKEVVEPKEGIKVKINTESNGTVKG
jgi:HSP20 family protein